MNKYKDPNYKKKYYKKNKVKINEINKKWRKDNSIRNRELIRRWVQNNPEQISKIRMKHYLKVRTTNDFKHKFNIRQQTRRKYGKLPKGFEYHHPKPYNLDMWVGMDKIEHRRFEKNVV